MTARCDYSDLPPDQCAHCKGHVAPRPGVTTEQAPPGWTEARYPGQCAGCGEPFTTGTYITYDPETARWIAECCAFTDNGGGW